MTAEYAFADPYHSLDMASDTLESTSSPVGATLDQIYSDSSINYIMWNDQDPTGDKHDSNGHSKGVIAWNEKGGFYLLHSTPRFPPDPQNSQYSFPQNEITYAQHFLCVTISFADVNTLAKHLQYVRPYIFSTNTPISLSSTPAMADLIDGVHITTPGTTSGYVSGWTHFAKNSEWGQDFWEDLVAQSLSMDLFVETWRRYPTLDTFCTPKQSYNVQNVCSLKFGDTSFGYTHDHSKWGISQSGSTVCIGDINRMTSQEHRGGGALCRSLSSLHSSLSDAIVSKDDCPFSGTTCPH